MANRASTSHSPELAPLDFPGLMAEIFRSYGRNFGLWVGIAACYEAVNLPLDLLEPTLGKGFLSAIQNPNSAYLTGQVELLGRVFALDLVSFCLFQVALAALAFALGARLAGRQVTVAAAYRQALEKFQTIMAAAGLSLVLPFGAWGGVALASIVVGLAAAAFLVLVLHSTSMLTFVFLVVVIILVLASIPGVIYITLRITLAMPVLATEGGDARRSLERSYSLSKGRVLRILGIVVVTGALVLIATSLVDVPFEIAGLVFTLQQSSAPFWFRLLGLLADRIAEAVVIPLLMLALSFVYLDLRVRHEGLTIQKLKHEIGV